MSEASGVEVAVNITVDEMAALLRANITVDSFPTFTRKAARLMLEEKLELEPGSLKMRNTCIDAALNQVGCDMFAGLEDELQARGVSLGDTGELNSSRDSSLPHDHVSAQTFEDQTFDDVSVPKKKAETEVKEEEKGREGGKPDSDRNIRDFVWTAAAFAKASSAKGENRTKRFDDCSVKEEPVAESEESLVRFDHNQEVLGDQNVVVRSGAESEARSLTVKGGEGASAKDRGGRAPKKRLRIDSSVAQRADAEAAVLDAESEHKTSSADPLNEREEDSPQSDSESRSSSASAGRRSHRRPARARRTQRRVSAAAGPAASQQSDHSYSAESESESDSESSSSSAEDGGARKRRRSNRGSVKAVASARQGVKRLQKTLMSRAKFLEDAQPLSISLNGAKFVAAPRIFSTKSCGWFHGCKMPLLIGETEVICQVSLNCTIVGSKEWKEGKKRRQRQISGGD